MARRARWIVIPLLSAAFGLAGAASSASADLFDCQGDQLPVPSQSNEPYEDGSQEQQQEVWVDGNDSVDIITVNPEVAIALQDEGDADTEGDGPSVSGGDSGVARQEDSSETNEGCIGHFDDTVDVLTINPELSATVDDDPLIFG
ncbi:MAG TPA: hypothetical protein VEG38_15405, partial [Acidimicrobiia bacterium]|nr:hypothetical protein [Acidimicrobiia bacterium]